MRRLLPLVLASLLFAVSPAAAAERGAPLAVGDRAPDFTLVDQHGRSFRLSEALGARRYVILAFYVKAFTPG